MSHLCPNSSDIDTEIQGGRYRGGQLSETTTRRDEYLRNETRRLYDGTGLLDRPTIDSIAHLRNLPGHEHHHLQVFDRQETEHS